MKISEMTNDQAADALIRIGTPFENICTDEEVIQTLEEIRGLGDQPAIKAFGTIIPLITKIALRKHRSDLYTIVSALTMTPVAKVGQMNFKETLNAVQDSYDDILRDFFRSTAILTGIVARK